MPFVEPPSWTHHKAEVDTGVQLHYVDVPASSPESSSSSSGELKGRAIVLIHGFPQTWYMWRHTIPLLSELGLRVIAVDYRGAGDSDRPRSGYDKMTMGRDIYRLYHDKLGLEKVIVCGSDIGSMVAVSLAVQFRESVEALITFEAPIPGTKAFDKVTSDPTFTWPLFWHFFFHNTADLPELLIQGKERAYISHFYQRLCYDPSFLTEHDLDIYTQAFSKPGGIRCGLDTYRAFLCDKEDLAKHLEEHGKASFPTLTMAGEASKFSKFIQDQTNEFASDVEMATVPHGMHWIPEENPSGWVEVVKAFLEKRKLL